MLLFDQNGGRDLNRYKVEKDAPSDFTGHRLHCGYFHTIRKVQAHFHHFFFGTEE